MKIHVLDERKKRLMLVLRYDEKFPAWLHAILRRNGWHCVVTFAARETDKDIYDNLIGY